MTSAGRAAVVLVTKGGSAKGVARASGSEVKALGHLRAANTSGSLRG